MKLFKSNPFQVSPGWAFVSYLILGIWTFIVLFPFYWLAVTAFKQPNDVNAGPTYIPFVDYQPSMRAFDELLGTNSGVFVTRPYGNTVVVGITSAVLALVLGAMAAYGLIRFDYKPKPGLIVTFAVCVGLMIVGTNLGIPWQVAVAVGLAIFLLLAQTIGRRFKGSMSNNDIFFWLVSQRMLPPVAVIIPIYIIFQRLGLLNTHLALIITYTAMNIPIVIWFLRDYFSGIPVELEESAFIDGASRYQVLWSIVLPLAVPGLIATFLIVLVFTWNEYTLGLFLSGADTQTMPPFVSAQNATRGPQWWNISVLVLLMVAPLFVLSVVLERFIARGLLIGAVKG